jgi:hypothetical protein
MPISFDLEALKIQHNCVNYLETGLWDPRNENISIHKALKAGFDHVFTIEILDEWVRLGNELFKKEVSENRLQIIHDDSTNMQKYLEHEAFKNKTMFFLDAHVDSKNISSFQKFCPVLEELKAINSLSRKDNVILVDDLRYLSAPSPWGENSYGDINFLETIKEYILTINKEYKFSLLNGHVKNDVLLAFV